MPNKRRSVGSPKSRHGSPKSRRGSLTRRTSLTKATSQRARAVKAPRSLRRGALRAGESIDPKLAEVSKQFIISMFSTMESNYMQHFFETAAKLGKEAEMADVVYQMLVGDVVRGFWMLLSLDAKRKFATIIPVLSALHKTGDVASLVTLLRDARTYGDDTFMNLMVWTMMDMKEHPTATVVEAIKTAAKQPSQKAFALGDLLQPKDTK